MLFPDNPGVSKEDIPECLLYSELAQRAGSTKDIQHIVHVRIRYIGHRQIRSWFDRSSRRAYVSPLSSSAYILAVAPPSSSLCSVLFAL
jgi:hypothetical protein